MNRSDLNSLVQARIIDNNTEEISPGDIRDVLAEYSTSQLNIEDDFELYGLRTMSARPYLVDEYFVFDNAIYQVITAHVASTTPDLTKVAKILDNNSGGGIADWVAGPVEAGKVYNYNGVLIRRDGGAITSSNPATEGGWKFLQNEMTTVSVVSSNLVYDCKGKESVSFFSSFNSNNNTASFINCPDGAMVRLVINNNSSTDKILNLAPPSIFGDTYNRVVIDELTLIPGINSFLLLKNKTIFGIASFSVLGTKVIAESNAVNEVYNIASWSTDTEKSATRAVLFDKFEADKTFYLDQIAQVREGLAPKTPVNVTIESNVNLAITHTTLDGETVNVGFRVALIGQTDLSENGIYVANGTGLLTRASDMNATTEFIRAYFYTEAGTNAGKRYIVSQAPAIVDTDDCIIIYQNSFVVPTATEVAVGTVELADSTEVDNTIALSTEPATATNKVLNLKQLWRVLDYLKTLFLTQASALTNYEFKNRTFSRSTNLALATPNIQTQVIRNSGNADITVFTNYTGCKINGQINKSVTVKPNQFATIKAIDSSDPNNYLVFVTDEVPVAGSGGGGGGGGTWGSITGTLSNQADLQSALTNTETNAKAYADGLVVGLLDDRGNYNPSTNSNQYPSTGGSGTSGSIKKGDLWTINGLGSGVSVAIGGAFVSDGDVVRALVDTPDQADANWVITENNIGYVPENANNKTNTIVGNENSTSLYSTIKGIVDYFTQSRLVTLLGTALSNKADKPIDQNIPTTGTITLDFNTETFDNITQTGSITFVGTNTIGSKKIVKTLVIQGSGNSAHTFTFPVGWINLSGVLPDFSKQNFIEITYLDGAVFFCVNKYSAVSTTTSVLVTATILQDFLNIIELKYDRLLDASIVMQNSWFTITGKTVNNVTIVNNTVRVQVSVPFVTTDTAVFNFTNTAGTTDGLQDAVGNKCPNIVSQNVILIRYAFDDFNRPDSTTSVGIASDGAAWQVINGTWGISGNRLYAVSAVNSGSATTPVIIKETLRIDCSVSLDITWGTTTGVSSIYVITRFVDINNFYILGFVRNQSKQVNAVVFKNVNGVFSQLGTANLVGIFADGTTQRYTYRVRGSQLQMIYNNTYYQNITDFSIITGTRVGIRIFDGVGSSGNTDRIDNFNVSE